MHSKLIVNRKEGFILKWKLHNWKNGTKVSLVPKHGMPVPSWHDSPSLQSFVACFLSHSNLCCLFTMSWTLCIRYSCPVRSTGRVPCIRLGTFSKVQLPRQSLLEDHIVVHFPRHKRPMSPNNLTCFDTQCNFVTKPGVLELVGVQVLLVLTSQRALCSINRN